MVNYHPAPELLADYTSGAMALSHSLCVAAHLEFCESCRQHVDKLTRVGAIYFEKQTVPECKQQDDDELKSKVLSMLDSADLDSTELDSTELDSTELDSTDEDTVVVNKTKSTKPAFKSLGQFMSGDFNELAWSRVTPSIKLATLLHDKDGSQIALSRTSPGGKMPHHAHTGEEITVVLEGSFSDERGVYHRGDFIYRDTKDKHTPVVTKDAECICLMVLDAPIQFTGFFTRLLNPLVRKHHAES